MYKLKGRGIFILALVIAIFINYYKVSAASTVDKGSLQITHIYHDEPLANVEFSIYKFATINEIGEFIVDESFKKYPINFSDLKDKTDWYLLYDTLANYAKTDNIPKLKEGVTNLDGKISFKELDSFTVYLVVGEILNKGGYKYEVKPFLVSNPSISEGNEIFDVKIYTKIDRTPIGDPGVFVQKKWINDNKENRPDWIKVSLYKNDSYYDNAILNEDNNWQHRWEGLVDGVDWSIVEEVPNGYTVTYEEYNGIITVTNSGSGSSGIIDKIPQTGTSQWRLIGINLFAVACIIIGYLLRRKNA